MIIVVDTEQMGEEWLGRTIDKEFLKDIKKFPSIDPCGEKGEYHTFVFEGPLFSKPVKFTKGKIHRMKNYTFLELAKGSNI